MLAPHEQEFCKQLLETLSDFDVQSLFLTVTQKQIAVDCKQEAIDAIIMCSESALELLRRQKLKKEQIRDYLLKFKGRINTPVVIKAEKSKLVDMVLKLWKDLSSEKNENASMPVQNINKLNGKINAAEKNNAQMIAESFVPWFYNMLNSVHENLNQSNNGQTWGSHHFWDDSNLCLFMEKPNETLDDEIKGSNQISEKLFSIILGSRIYFSPNFERGGINGEMNRHGLLIVRSAGTLHRSNSMVGLYEQAFGLIKDPCSQNNWKIKDTKLRMRLSHDPSAVTNG